MLTGDGGPHVSGDPIDFTCSVTGGNPTPDIVWQRNDQILTGESSATLSVDRAVENNGATYFCQAVNDVGTLDSNAITMVVVGESILCC